MKVLGIVSWVTDKTGHFVGGVTPIFEVAKTKLIEIDKTEDFPPSGQAFWSNVKEASVGSIVLFDAKENDGQDKMRVTDPQVLPEVLDLRVIGDAEAVRKALEAGISNSFTPAGKVMVWCAPNELIGPIKISKSLQAVLKLENGTYHRLPVHSPGKNEVTKVVDGKTEKFVVLPSMLSTPVRYIDWDEDKVMAKRTLGWIVDRRKEKGFESAAKKKVIDEVAEALASFGNPEDASLDQYRLRRLSELLSNEKTNRLIVAEILDLVSILPNVQEKVESIHMAAIAEAKAGASKEIQAELAKIEELKGRRVAVEAENTQAEKKLTNARAKLEAQVGVVDSEISRRIHEIIEKPEKLVAEIAILRAVLGVGNSTLEKADAHDLKRASLKWVEASQKVSSSPEIRKALVASFRMRGLAPANAIRIHAAVISGVLPIVVGARAVAALEAYCAAIVGNRIARISVTPTLMDVGQLFLQTGRADTKGRLTEIYEAVQLSNSNANFSMAIVEGLNRGAAESYLLPLLNTLEGTRDLSSLFATGHGTSLVWPKNLCLAATCIEGPTSLPLSRDVMTFAAIIDVGEELFSGADAKQVLSELVFDKDFTPSIESSKNTVATFVGQYPEANLSVSAISRFAAAISLFESDQKTVNRHLVECFLIPSIVTLPDEDERTRALEKLLGEIVSDDEKEKMNQFSKRLRRRLA